MLFISYMCGFFFTQKKLHKTLSCISGILAGQYMIYVGVYHFLPSWRRYVGFTKICLKSEKKRTLHTRAFPAGCLAGKACKKVTHRYQPQMPHPHLWVRYPVCMPRHGHRHIHHSLIELVSQQTRLWEKYWF